MWAYAQWCCASLKRARIRRSEIGRGAPWCSRFLMSVLSFFQEEQAPPLRQGRSVRITERSGVTLVHAAICRKTLQSPRFYDILITERRWRYEKNTGDNKQYFICFISRSVFHLLFRFGVNVYHQYRFYLVVFLYNQCFFKCELSLHSACLHYRNCFVYHIQNKRKI